jgi:hypothetical protein
LKAFICYTDLRDDADDDDDDDDDDEELYAKTKGKQYVLVGGECVFLLFVSDVL